MLDRMKKDFIAAKIQSAEYEKSLKNKSYVLDLEQQKQRLRARNPGIEVVTVQMVTLHRHSESRPLFEG